MFHLIPRGFFLMWKYIHLCYVLALFLDALLVALIKVVIGEWCVHFFQVVWQQTSYGDNKVDGGGVKKVNGVLGWMLKSFSFLW
jgi:hypothetical protein